MRICYLLISHGSRQSESNQDFWNLVDRFRKAYPDRWAEGCFLELTKPSVSEALAHCVKKGAEEIFVLPLMLFSGRHVRDHIPNAIEEAHAQYPHVSFHYATPLGDHPSLLRVLEEKIESLKATDYE